MIVTISNLRFRTHARSGFPDVLVGRTMGGRKVVVWRVVTASILRRLSRAGGAKHAVASLTVENYVKTIALIAARSPEGSLVGTGELAQALNVSPGTVTGMLKTLSEANLATYTPYEGARLTESGQRLAMKVIRRHRLLERFLAETLTMSWDEVHEEAEHMEHAASERLIDRIDAYLGHPAVDPHGDPIPRADGSLAQTEGIPLARCQPGQHFRVVRVTDQDPSFLRYLSECGLELHATGELLENRPEAGALVCLLGGRNVALGLAAASKLLVVVTQHEVRAGGPGTPNPAKRT